MWINAILEYWMEAPWTIAFLMATAVHLTIYFSGALIGIYFTQKLWPAIGLGAPIDTHPPKPGQVRMEIRNGVAACFILGLATTSYQHLCHELWPDSAWEAAGQIIAFFLFNNAYAYAAHRLLHSRALIRYHAVHHRSVRVTPWSGYSVHPFEAVFIALTVPLFLLVMPLGIGTAFILHAVGMLFTICIHCNYDLMPQHDRGHWLKKMLSDPAFHRLHHTLGRVNYGFHSRFLDEMFKTVHLSKEQR